MSKKDGSLIKNTLLLSLGAMLTKGLAFVLIPFFSSWISTENYGSFDVFCTYVSLMIPIITLSTGEAIFRFSVDNDSLSDKKSYVTNGLFIIILNLVLMMIFFIPLRVKINSKLYLPFLLLLVGELFNNHLQAYLRAIRKLNIYSFGSAITTIGFAIFVTIFVKVKGLGLSGMICGYALGYLFGDIILIFISGYHKYVKVTKISKEIIFKMITYSYALIPNSLCWWVINVSDRMIIKLFLGEWANGIYAIAYKIPNLCISVFGMFSISWQQEASTLDKEEEKEIYFNKVYNNILNLLLGLCAGVISCNFILFLFVFSKKYYEAYLYAPILCLAIIFSSLSQFYGGIQIALKHPKANGISTSVGAIANFIINIILIKYIGLYAAAFSTLAANCVVSTMRKKQLEKYYRIRTDKKNKVNIIVFVYFFISSYYIENIVFDICNLCLAGVFFVLNNKAVLVSMRCKLKAILGDRIRI